MVSPKVLIGGWFGSKPRHFKKLAEYYVRNGIEPVIINPSLLVITNGPAGQRCGDSILKTIDQQPFYLHMFSQCKVLTGYIYQSQHYNKNLHLGTIFDSANATNDLPWAHRAIRSNAKNEVLGNILCSLATPIMSKSINYYGPRNQTAIIQNQQPEIYMHGNKDTIAPIEPLRNFIIDKHGNDHNLVEFDGLSHVQLLKKDTKKYVHHLDEFIKCCTS